MSTAPNPVERALLGVSTAWPARTRPLADPPAGSGLRPIMGDAGVPVIGHSLEPVLDFLTQARARRASFGPVSWAGSPLGPIIAVSSPEATERILRNVDRSYANGPGWEALIGPFFHRGVMLMDFEEHLHHRRIMQSAFTRDRLRGYLATMQPGLAAGVGAWRPGPAVTLLPKLKHLLLANASDVFVGSHLEGAAEKAVFTAFLDTVRAGGAIFRRDVVPGTRWSKGVRGREVLEAYVRDLLPEKKAQTEHDDVFAAFVHGRDEDGNAFSDDDVVNHLIFLLMAAHDTSTITLSTMMWAMGTQPEWQEQARAESDAIGARPLTWDDLDALPTLDLLQKEALRLVPPVYVMMRAAVRDTELVGHHVPAGALIMLSPFVTQRSPDVWDDPDTFDPTRFAPGGEAERVHPYGYTPFGGGVHKCIGMHFAGVQIKALLHQVLQRHRWSLPPDRELRLDTSSLPVPSDGLPVDLQPR